MSSGFRVCQIFGISIHIDWSWLFIFVLVTWNLTALFAYLHPDWSLTLRSLLAVIAAILFFLSVLAHELAHSLTAKAQNIAVSHITLFLFGGVSNIQRHPSSPKAEFLITIVGPATSIALGLLFILISGIGQGTIPQNLLDPLAGMAQLNPITTILLWLGPINLFLGIFNLIPGFPLDGGRVLRSILWAATNNLSLATRWASWIGQGVAWLMIIAGLSMIFGIEIPILGSGLINGLWLAFIGWFLNSASIQSYQQVLAQDILDGVKVGSIMRVDPPHVQADASVNTLVHDLVMRTDDHAFPVLGVNGELIGLVTLDDIRKVSREEWISTTVSQIMTPANQLVTIAQQEDAAEALLKLKQYDIRQLPVLSNNRLVGLLRRQDIIRWLQIQSDSASPFR